MIWNPSWGTGLVAATVGVSNGLAYNTETVVESVTASSVNYSVWNDSGILSNNIPVGFLLTAEANVWRTNHTTVGPDTNYWTDPFSYTLLVDEQTNSTGNAIDNSGSGHTVANKPNAATGPSYAIIGTNAFGRVERGWTMDASDDYIEVADADDLTMTTAAGVDSKFTVAAWVKLNANAEYGVIAKDQAPNNREYSFYVSPGPYATLYILSYGAAGYPAAAGQVFPTNEWVFIAGTYDGSSNHAGLCVYTCSNSISLASNVTRSAGGTYVGMTNTTAKVGVGSKSGDSAANPMNGKIDFAAIIKGTNLTQAELTILMSKTIPTNNIRAHLPAGGYP